MPDKVIGVGIVGVGNWARYGHIPSLKMLPQYDIRAVSSRHIQQARAVAQEFAIAEAFDSVDELVASAAVDFVVILPPAPFHAESVEKAIAAGKDVYCEWPLSRSTDESESLLRLASNAGVRHVVGLQRRMGPSARYVRDLLAEGYIGKLRSARLHVSMEYFGAERSSSLAWTIDPSNFSHVLSIYGGHFLDLLFQIVGPPKTISAETAIQFPELRLTSTGETFVNRTPDGIVAIGNLANSALFTLQIEGGKKNLAGFTLHLTGDNGDLEIRNEKSFTNQDDNSIFGAQGTGRTPSPLEIPPRYICLPQSTLDASVMDLSYLYAGFSGDPSLRDQKIPTFGDAVKMHQLIDAISESALTGQRVNLF